VKILCWERRAANGDFLVSAISNLRVARVQNVFMAVQQTEILCAAQHTEADMFVLLGEIA